MLYTAEIFRADRRTKVGERAVSKLDIEANSVEELTEKLNADYPSSKGYRFNIRETMVTRKNIMTGKLYQERYDTPIYCSPAFESYWSM